MTLDQLDKYSRAVVIGLGKSGLATTRFLNNLGLKVYVSESRPMEQINKEELAELDQQGTFLETGGHTEKFIKKNSLIVPSPGVPLNLPVLDYGRQQNCTIAGELALAAGRIDAPVIAVTGTNGKTTVTSLIGEMLRSGDKKVFICGNIGTPVLEYLTAGEKADIIVMEVSSFQLEISGSFRPDIGVLLNLSPDHLDRHGSMEAYGQAKLKMFANQTAADKAIVNRDDEFSQQHSITSPGTIFYFGGGYDCDARVLQQGVVVATMFAGHQVTEEYDLGNLMSSDINRLNCAAAILAARLGGIDQDAVNQALHSFRPPAHRMEPVLEINQVRYIDDSKATNIGAMRAALTSCTKPVVLIAGGRNKNSDFSVLKSVINNHVKQLILIGEASDEMALAVGSGTKIARADSMADAVAKACLAAVPGDIVLLSPGCASFDMFSNYAERGRVFQNEVLALASRHIVVSAHRYPILARSHLSA